MKTLKLITLSLLLASASLTANPTHKVENLLTTSENNSLLIKNAVQIPEQFIKQGFKEKVTVHFLVNEKGEVVQVLCVSADPELKNSVESQFSGLNFSDLKQNTLYTVNINFKVI